MGLLDRFTRSGFAKIASQLPDDAREERVFSTVPSVISAPQAITTASTWAQPPQRGSIELLAAYLVSPPFRSVVERISQAFASVPYYVHTRGAEDDFNAPICQLIKRYNRQLIGSQGRQLEQIYLDILGESIVIMLPISGPQRYELYPVSPTWVTVEQTDEGELYIVRIPGRGEFRFPAPMVAHRRTVDPTNPYGRTRGAGYAVADEIEADEYASKHSKAYFYNSMKPEFIMTVKGTESQARDMKAKLADQHQGFRKAWSPMVTSAELTLHELTRKLGDEKIVELRKSYSDIIRWTYGIPPEIVGIVDNSNRATAKEADHFLGKYVVEPRAVAYQEAVLHFYGEAFGNPDLRHVSSIPREFDRQDEIRSRHAHHFTRNEVRMAAGHDPVSDGDVYAVPVNLVEVQAERPLSQRHKDTRLRIITGARNAE